MSLQEAIERSLRELGLPMSLSQDVQKVIDDPNERARSCCGGFCEPCIDTLKRAADRALRIRNQSG